MSLAFLVALCTTRAGGVHMAFILPPASPRGAMLPVACAALEAGHNVSFLAYDDDAAKLHGMIPGAKIFSLGSTQRPDVSDKMSTIMNIPYEVMAFSMNIIISLFDTMVGKQLALAALPVIRELQPDVLCVTSILPSNYALGELVNIPVVGLGFSAPWLFSNILELPWSLEPALGSWYTREEIASKPALLAWNAAVRMHGFLFRNTLGFVLHNVMRLQMGLSRLELSQFESILANPMVVPSLPELTAGFPPLMSTNIVMAGMYDHPMLDGASLSKSAQRDEIVSWLDGYSEKGLSVLYCAFGSEAVLDVDRAEPLLKAFGSIPVLWVLKTIPPGLPAPPANVFITAWSPQKTVLAHPAVKAFLSHGGGNSMREAVAAGVPMLVMPFFGDQPMNAMIHEELGVAIRVHKNRFTPESLRRDFERISTGSYQQRAADVKSFNDKHVSLARAVEVVENAANKRFSMHVKQHHALLLSAPMVLFVVLACLLRAGCQCCCQCCCRARLRSADSKNKTD
eukprot:CAMPEP_0117483124 /NCGR_PEP_ID=MMETSP0784-20121206/13775_1 /TAXON_ID=39447 /ORGANISM="" /LENGTH=511 /DNA_ID=CAMNT_0005277645 /DNA_START=89 /DNA_END=1624 /DNA_ORIENTATION=+